MKSMVENFFRNDEVAGGYSQSMSGKLRNRIQPYSFLTKEQPMRKLILIAITALSLAGCQSAQDVATTITTSTQTVSEKVKSVQGYAVSLCGYLPLSATVASIFNTSTGSNVAVVGSAICNAVTTLPLADGPGDRKPRVAGVVVKGQFVK